jgi:tetratricopeptide (TPR) repeat protein
MAAEVEADDVGSGLGSATGVAESLAAAIAGEAAKSDPAMAIRAALVLDEQAEVLRLQKERLRKEDKTLAEEQRLRLSHLRHRRFGDYAKAMMEVAIALLIVALLTGFGILVWRASEAHGLVVEPLRTPSDFAARGLDGTMLAQRLLDKLNADVAEAEVGSIPPQTSVSGSWGSDSKVMIPSTGISLDDLERALRRWLGHETHMSGEIWRTPAGIALSMRVEGGAGVTFTGSENDLDKLLDSAALQMLAQTQPITWGDLVSIRRGPDAAVHLFKKLAATSPSLVERAWAFANLGGSGAYYGKHAEAAEFANKAAALDPANITAIGELAPIDAMLEHAEPSLIACNRFFGMVNGGAKGDLSPLSFAGFFAAMKSGCAQLHGAYGEAASAGQELQEYHFFLADLTAPMRVAAMFALDHDGKSARAALVTRPQYSDRSLFYIPVPYSLPNFELLKEARNWPAAAADLGAVDAAALRNGRFTAERHRLIWPWLAYSWARRGNLKGANELVALTPLDCSLCLRMRGTVRDLSGDPVGASRWFARAVNDAPSSPFPYFDWGTMLLHRGDYDGAIAKFELAHEKGPHFADPLEMWGEALIAENRSDLALEKFADANSYAPNWGRLHLKWGEALLWLGRKDEARNQFDVAAGLDLATPDRAQLEVVRRRLQ